MRPICVPCARFFRPKKNGYYFIEGMPRGSGALPGNLTPELWTHYKLWVGDLYECPGCGTQTIVGVPSRPLAEHYQPDFEENVAHFNGGQFRVNDC